MVGLGKCASWFQRHSWLARIARRLSAGLSSRSRKKSWMSWPALQLSPAPVSTSTFASGATASCESAAIISSCICGLIALRFSGRFIVTQAMSCATSTFTVWSFEKSILLSFIRRAPAGHCSNERMPDGPPASWDTGRDGKANDSNIRARRGGSIPDTYEVFAIRYASLSNRKASENFIGGDPHESASDLDYFVWLARSKARAFVIDTGFDARVGTRRGRRMTHPPERGLALLGVEAKEVEDVIITHLHYDHVGNFGLFPAATFHLQDEEMAYATGRHMAQGFFNYAYEADEVAAMVREVYKGRVRFHDGDAELAPGLSLHRIGGHTRGLQAVRVHTRIGWIVLASDAAHLYANMNETRPFPIVFDVAAMVEGYRRLRELADAPELVVPGHDPLVMRRYAPPRAALKGIAVRLDRRPKP